MKIIVTGSLGHISRPLTAGLVQKGHEVIVISSNADRQKEIELLGARASIGSVEDVSFLTETFMGADAAYCMAPPSPTHFADPNFDIMAYCKHLGANYAQAIRQAGVQRVVHLSSIGTHLDKDSGLLLAHVQIENALKELHGIGLTHLRPAAFYYNLYAFINVIKATGNIVSNYGGDDSVNWVAPADIAAVAVEELTRTFIGRDIRYVASDEPTCSEIATAIGAAIGKPDMQWLVIPDAQMLQNLKTAGLAETIAEGMVEMNSGIHKGIIMEDYLRHRPVLGKVKIADFAKEFASVYNKS